MKVSFGHKLVNFLTFQLAWFSCVLGAANGMPWLGPLVVLTVVALHLALVATPIVEVKLLFSAAAIGLVFDSMLVNSGWLAYPNGILLPGTAPVWILAMWVLFATTLNVSMRWLKASLVLAALMGGIFGPLSYLAGSRLGAVEFVANVPAIVALAIGWTLAMPLLVWLSNRLDGTREPASAVRAREQAGSVSP